MTGIRFLFRVTLRRHDLAAEVWHIKEPQKLPPVLSPEEVKRVLTMAPSLKARAMLTLAYGCGLRASEVVRLRAGDIDSEQMIIRIVQSKGRKDRHVMLPAEVLDLLRQWWKARPTKEDAGVAPEQRWLFPGRSDHQPLTTRQFSRLFKEAAKAAGLRKTTTPTSPSAARTIASTAPAAGRRCGFTRTSSSGASCCTCCPRASTASATTGSLPPPTAPRTSRRPVHSSMSPRLPSTRKSSRTSRRMRHGCCPARARSVALA